MMEGDGDENGATEKILPTHLEPPSQEAAILDMLGQESDSGLQMCFGKTSRRSPAHQDSAYCVRCDAPVSLRDAIVRHLVLMLSVYSHET